MILSSEQQAALDLGRPTSLGAGAGSGKTGVLIERYVRAVAACGFDLDAVLAVTFTKKATAEMLARVRARVAELAEGDVKNRDAWARVGERLGDAWILTLDAFCNRLLSTMGPAAGFPAQRTILTGGALQEVVDDALRDVVDGIARDEADPDRADLRVLLAELGGTRLVDHLETLLARRSRSVPWARSVREEGAAGDAAEQPALAALARLFERVLARYRALLAARNACDFRQLLEDVDVALDDPAARAAWSARFRHVLVDEFQDTDPLQWDVLRRLFGGDRITRPGLFVVGDEKQAIFSFRDGDVTTFRAATAAIEAAPDGAAVALADNYRSSASLVAFFNALAASMFAGASNAWEARHAPMQPRRAEPPDGPVASRVELLVGVGADAAEGRLFEHAALAARLEEMVTTGAVEVLEKTPGGPRRRPATYADAAILLRKRTHLDALEAALGARGIPFKVLGGVGFFDQHEVRALRNLMRFLADPQDDLAVLGVLRSALFGVADSALLAATRRSAAERGRSLWRRVRDLAEALRSGGAALPTPEDAPAVLDAAERLSRYAALAGRLSPNELLALVVRESDYLLTLDVVDPSGRAAANVEKLLDLVRRHARNGVATFDGIERSIALAVGASDDPEAQADPPASGRPAVSILTVHAAKGLEWPIVFVTGCEHDATADRGQDEKPPAPVRDGPDGRLLYSLKTGSEARKSVVATKLKTQARAERCAEEKRLLYVAVTRARDHLVMTAAEARGSATRAKGDRWIRWILEAGGDVTCREAGALPDAPAAAGGGMLAIPEGIAAAAPPAAPAGEVVLRVPATAAWLLGECPHRFFLENVIGARDAGTAPPHAEDGTSRPDARARGSIVHAALEGVATGVDPVARVKSVAAAAGIRDAAQVRELEAHVRRALEGLRRWDVGRAILDAAGEGVEAETPFDHGAGAVRIVGAIDLLHRLPAGGAVVVDFKTNARVPAAEAKARDLVESLGYGDQMRAYAAAARARFGDPVAAYVFFTDSGRPLPIVGGGAEAAPWAAAKVDAILELARTRMEAGFPKTADARACERCPHRPARCEGSGS